MIRKLMTLLVLVNSLLFFNPLPASANSIRPITSTHYLPNGRNYVFHRDANSRATKPLVIILPGVSQTGDTARKYTGAERYSDYHNFNVIFANGLYGTWNAGGCCRNAHQDDVQYLKDVVNDISKQVNVDRSRVYIWGFSNGGMMAYKAQCDAPSYFAAVGVQSGSLIQNCPNTKLTVRHIHGTIDTIVPYRGGYSSYVNYTFRDSRYERYEMGPNSIVNTTLIHCGHTWATTSNCNYDTTNALWQFSIRYHN